MGIYIGSFAEVCYHARMDALPLAIVPLLAFVSCVLLHLAALRWFPRMGLLDFPERYGYARARLPYPAGIVCVVSFLAFFCILQPWNMQNTGLLIGIAAIAATSFIDDRMRLPAWMRLAIQVLTAILLFATGTRIYSLTNPLSDIGIDSILKLDTFVVQAPLFGTLPVLSGIFTILWLILTINALNWFDGIPGQVNVLSTVGFATIGFLSLSDRVGQPALALLAFVLAGIAAGALLFDFPPPKVIAGDTGAMFFGLMLGVLTIYAGGKVATGFLVFGVPLIDLVIVVARRLRKGSSPMKGNAVDEHLHHRLLAKGWPPRAVIALMLGIGTVFGVTALFLSTTQKFLAGGLLFLCMLLLSAYSEPKKTR